jgi:hypothetical protein
LAGCQEDDLEFGDEDDEDEEEPVLVGNSSNTTGASLQLKRKEQSLKWML